MVYEMLWCVPVCLSQHVCLSHSSKATAAGVLLWAWQAGDIEY